MERGKDEWGNSGLMRCLGRANFKSAGLPACLIGRCCSCFRSCFVLVSVLGLYLFLCSLAARFCFVLSLLAEGSLEVKLPTIWTVEKQR